MRTLDNKALSRIGYLETGKEKPKRAVEKPWKEERHSVYCSPNIIRRTRWAGNVARLAI
jgi:hypothetical protein